MEPGQRVLRRRGVNGLSLMEVEMDEGSVVSANRHPNACFQLVLEGRYYEPPADALRKRFTVHFHPSEDAQAAVCDSRTRLFGICIPGERKDLTERFGGFPTESGDLLQPEIVQCMSRIYSEFLRGDAPSELAIEGICYEMLAHFARSTAVGGGGRPPSWLRRANEIVCDDPAGRHSLSSIAAECGVHPSHLAREFRRFYGTTVGANLREARCRLAGALLQSGELTLDAVADMAGFYDASHLAKSLRRQSDLQP